MDFKKILPALLSVLFLFTAVILKASIPAAEGSKQKQTAKVIRTSQVQPRETRGVWVTYMTLDVENESDKEAAFDKKIDTIIKDMKSGGFNTMIVQVRPFCDAIYQSDYYPFSHIISGEQGVDPGFDPLGHIIEKCRKSGIFIHAWINPYRVRTENTPAQLSGDNPCIIDEDLCVEINGKLYLDPASDDTISLIADGITELVENYDIDGVQFDDYFYPEKCGDFDADTYEAYSEASGENFSLAEFRKNNVNRMVKAAYTAAHEANENIVFGISPQGNPVNNAGLYADVETWCAEEGYIDYICPQLYYSLDNPALTFEDSLAQWLSMKKHNALRLYIGLAGYKAGTDADDGTWLDNDDILKTEIESLRTSGADGFILYSYDSFHNEDNRAEIQNLIRYLTTSATQ